MSSEDDEIVYVTQEELALKVYHAKLAGYSIHRIAMDFDITEDDAVRAFNYYRTSRNTTSMDREEAKLLELDRLDDLTTTFHPMAKSGDTSAANTVLKIMDSRAKLLQFDAIDPSNRHGAANIIILGEDRASFMEALQQGRYGVEDSEKMVSEEAVDERSSQS